MIKATFGLWYDVRTESDAYVARLDDTLGRAKACETVYEARQVFADAMPELKAEFVNGGSMCYLRPAFGPVMIVLSA